MPGVDSRAHTRVRAGSSPPGETRTTYVSGRENGMKVTAMLRWQVLLLSACVVAAPASRSADPRVGQGALTIDTRLMRT